MEILFAVLVKIATVLVIIINNVLNWIYPTKKPKYPPIRNRLLTKSITELLADIRTRKLTSKELVSAYIERIKEVNPYLNAVIEDRFEEALKEAEHADQLISQTSGEQLLVLFSRYPMLGLPFTVKESCGVKGMSFTVGNVLRKNLKSPENGKVVGILRSAGCIPLLVSANPEFCMSLETSSHLHGRCLNPYDMRRVSAGSSGGEGALHGSGASLFGVGSDIAGSIRLPALFCGVFGHKPTGGLVSVEGHFPNSPTDELFSFYLQLGPITRFARDLPLLLQVMAGSNADKLKYNEAKELKDIKIYYSYGFPGFNPPTSFDIKLAILKAVKCFEKGGLSTKEVNINGFRYATNMVGAMFGTIKGTPSIMTNSSTNRPTSKALFSELLKSVRGRSINTKEALFLEAFQSQNGLIPEKNIPKWIEEIEKLKQQLLNLLGDNGVLFLPTFHTSAICFNMCPLYFVASDLLAVFNLLGFPATAIPMGMDRYGRPIGFQVIAAPYQDKLCLQIAAEMEGAFGGWEPLYRHNFTD